MLRVYVINQHESRDFEHKEGPLEFGRGPERQAARCVINDPFVSKDQLRISTPMPGRIKLENLSGRNPLRLGEDQLIAPGEVMDTRLPARITIGKTLIELSEDTGEVRDSSLLRTIDQPIRHTIAAGSQSLQSLQALISQGRSPTPEVLAQWFETLVTVQRAAATSAQFYSHTARAMVELVGLDMGLVLLRDEGKWKIAAEFKKDARHETVFSERILKRVVDEKRTFFQALGTDMLTRSLMEVEAVVVSPIFGDEPTDVVGAVYGTRYHRLSGSTVEIRPLEAQVVQVLAAAVGSGMAREERMAEATRRYVQLEQTFTPELARELDRDPSLLEGRSREVTILFGDIRNFSRLSEKLGPADTCRLVQDVLEKLTARIREFQGVLVDYMGDGFMAMWNAPQDQPKHAELACRAALAMTGDLPELSAKWQPIVGQQLRLGLGINTGPAMVGNTGTAYKLKYGPLGHTVNLASRVEGATKHLEVAVLITGSTQAQLCEGFATRRLCKVRVVGIEGKVDLYELCPTTADDAWTARRTAYETALQQYESKNWADACRSLYPLLVQRAGADGMDIPSLNLLARAVDCLKDPPKEFDPVIEFRQK